MLTYYVIWNKYKTRGQIFTRPEDRHEYYEEYYEDDNATVILETLLLEDKTSN